MGETEQECESAVDLMRNPDAPAVLAGLGRTYSAARDITGLLWVLRYADVERLSSDGRLQGVGLNFFDQMGINGGPLRRWYGSLMFTNEGANHRRLRRLVSGVFKPKAVETLRDATRELVQKTFGELRRDGGGDLVGAFQHVPMRVMCELLGVPHADVPLFVNWADALTPVFLFMSPEEIAGATEAIAALLGYVDQVVARRRSDPGNDLISALITTEDEGHRLTHEELLDMVANLLVAGHDTTRTQIGCTFIEILKRPQVMTALSARPQAIASAVEETLRLSPSIGLLPRTVLEPIAIGGAVRAPGTLLGLATAAANRDARAWARPDEFVFDRFESPAASRVLTLGTGPHNCIGAHLARMTLTEVVRGLLETPCHPSVDPATVPWRVVLGRSPVSLPVTVH
jgi:cytochrome P450